MSDLHLTLNDEQRSFLREQLSQHIAEHMPKSFDSYTSLDYMKDWAKWTWLNQLKTDLYMHDYRPGSPGWKDFKKIE